MRLLALALAALALAGCGKAPPLPADEAATLDPVAFFAGRTQGAGSLDPLLGRSSTIRVESLGKRAGGGLVLDQRIAQQGKSPRMRRWTIRPAGEGRFAGELTDARGPVAFAVDGPRAFIAYRMHNGMQVEQQLALQPDRRTLRNRLTVSRFGLRLAQVDEVIRKLD